MYIAKGENATLILALDSKDALNNVFKYKYPSMQSIYAIYEIYVYICVCVISLNKSYVFTHIYFMI